METRYEAKCAELDSPSHQIVFHGTDERSNVDSILHHGFDKNRVKRVRRVKGSQGSYGESELE